MPIPGLLSATLLSIGQGGPFIRTPENGWVFEGLRTAIRQGMLPEKRGTLTGYRKTLDLIRDRYETAVVFHALATNQLQALETFEKKPVSDAERAGLLREVALLPYYKKAEREFKKEYQALGVLDDFGQSKIVALTKKLASTSAPRHFLFKDVPAEHWASKAVGDLRALGLLDGYPDQRFRGSN